MAVRTSLSGVLTKEQVFCALVDTLISKVTWAALIQLSELPHIKDDTKLGRGTLVGK